MRRMRFWLMSLGLALLAQAIWLTAYQAQENAQSPRVVDAVFIYWAG